MAPQHAVPRTDRVAAAPRGRRRPRQGALLLATVLGLLSAAALAACSAPPPEIPDPVTVTPTIVPSRTTPPEPDVPVVWPLTGVATEEIAARPAVAVKIENTSSARPQTGLEQADVVWETIVEFEISRLIAVYHSQVPAEIGPVRSVRPMDPLVVSPLGGLLVFSGGQAGILSQVYATPGVQVISHDAGADGLYRVSFRYAPHNVYGDISRFVAQADAQHSAAPQQQFAFALRPELATAALTGTPAGTLAFRLSSVSNPSWTWDAGSSTWARSEGSSPSNAASGARLTAVNVVSIVAGHPPSGFLAQANASVPTYNLIGEGTATVATGGKTVAATWRKAAVDAPLQLFGADGTPVLLAPGNTWVELVPAETGSLTVG